MELLAAMALDRDAINTVTLRLLPPSAAPGAAVSPWLLWHTIPITASLSRTLSRLVSVETSAMAQTPQETLSSFTAASSATPPVKFGSLTAATVTTTLMPSKVVSALAPDITEDTAARCSSAYRSPERKARSSSVASKSSSSSTLSTHSARTTLTLSTTEAEKASWIELVRVGYVVSEIHAYCILFKCRCAAQAAMMKAALEEGAALGLTAPVEYVSDARPVVVTHRTFAESQGEVEAVAVGTDDPSVSDYDHDGDHRHRPRASARWSTGVHIASHREAIATVYPVRGNGDSVGGEGGGDGASDGDDGHQGATQPLKRRHQYHHLPHHLQSSSHTVSSAPATPSPARRLPAASRAMRKGAAPPRSRHASAVAAAVATPTSSCTGSSQAAAVAVATGARVSPSRPAHTPPHTPLAACGGGGGAGLGPLSSGDFCTICLDPLYLSACVTTLCQHSFHLSCYAQLPSGSAECPLCRFSVYELLNDARCNVCGTYEDLWVCLICGHVACGRARRDHQQEHYHLSMHSCSWQSTTNRIRNLSSRMFLHQEVALLLEEDGLDGAAPAHGPQGRGPTTRVLSADAATGEAATSSGNTGAATTAMGGARSPTGVDRVRYMSWSDSLVDDDLQEALNESKEEAVAQYYTNFLRQLAEEQHRWYEAALAERRRRRSESQVAAGASVGGSGAESASCAPVSRTTLMCVALNERRQRRRVLSEYVQATITLLQAAQREYAGMAHTLKAARDDAQQRVLLCSHLNAGLVAQAAQVRQRTRELQRRGEKASQVKAAEEARLQCLVEKALSSL
ncbi:hypothetical protein GH5_08508 [Leishmania sp. Ghana 2012 LV757]|uniref:hypothetical protein n=1 Tax=Leishmania sp. Ghana 2012 LV757 TaxID=2803181 RepID=UPI001B542069|nr:hypothetical protein GH5_08508 [Leishmania sp. Ghana 2012 LV757]